MITATDGLQGQAEVLRLDDEDSNVVAEKKYLSTQKYIGIRNNFANGAGDCCVAA